MSAKQPPTPRKSDLVAASAANLRANLLKRKAQGQARRTETLPSSSDSQHEQSQ